jgi:hypothetical protein
MDDWDSQKFPFDKASILHYILTINLNDPCLCSIRAKIGRAIQMNVREIPLRMGGRYG